MADRTAEIEAAGDRGGGRRRPAAALVLAAVAALVAGGLAWFGYAREARFEEGLSRALAALGEQPAPEGGAAAQLRRLDELARATGSVRDLTARAEAETGRRDALERELAAARDEVAALTRERDGLRAGIDAETDGRTAAEAGRVQAEERAAAEEGAARTAPDRAAAEVGQVRGELAVEREAAVRRDRALAVERGEADAAGTERDRALGEVQAREAELGAAQADLAEAGEDVAERDRAVEAADAGRAASATATGQARNQVQAEAGAADAARDEAGAARAEAAAARGQAAGSAAALDAERQARDAAEARSLAAEARAAEVRADRGGAGTGGDLAEPRPDAPAGEDDVGPMPVAGGAERPVTKGEGEGEGASSSPEVAERTLATFMEGLGAGGGDERFELLGEDRVVVRSSRLFPSSGATISGEGTATLEALAGRLREAVGRIPPGVPWALRIDGHADDVPVRETAEVDSNWQLSAVRASRVVDFLVAAGLPPEHLVLTAFGNTRPLAPGTDEAARERNRRIELRFVTR